MNVQKCEYLENGKSFLGEIKVVNKYCRKVHASIRSIENCCSLEIFNASITDLQGKTQICNYKSCNYAIINHARYYFKGTIIRISHRC